MPKNPPQQDETSESWPPAPSVAPRINRRHPEVRLPGWVAVYDVMNGAGLLLIFILSILFPTQSGVAYHHHFAEDIISDLAIISALIQGIASLYAFFLLLNCNSFIGAKRIRYSRRAVHCQRFVARMQLLFFALTTPMCLYPSKGPGYVEILTPLFILVFTGIAFLAARSVRGWAAGQV